MVFGWVCQRSQSDLQYSVKDYSGKKRRLEKLNSGVVLNWKTAQEVNNAYFEVERKTDQQKDFEVVKNIMPLKTGSVKSYTYVDQTNFKNDHLMYRIKQVDLDGKWGFSNTISINKTILSDALIVSPNPVQDYFVMKNYLSTEPVELFDANGKSVAIKIDGNKINLLNFPSGIYFLNITDLNSQRRTIKIIKE